MPVTYIDTDDIVEVSNVRTDVNDPGLVPLMESMNQYGILQPVGVIAGTKGKHNLLWGHRRLAAARKLGWKKLEVDRQIVILDREMTEADYLLINVLENVQRKDINPIELGAVAVKLNEEQKLSFREIAARLNLPAGRITTAVDTYLNTPTAYRKDIGFVKGSDKKRGLIPAGTMEWVSHNIPPQHRESILDEIKKHEIAQKHLSVLKALLEFGMPFEEAMQKMYNYRNVSVDFLVDKVIANALEEEHGKTINDVIRWWVMTGIRPRKDLIFNPEVAKGPGKEEPKP